MCHTWDSERTTLQLPFFFRWIFLIFFTVQNYLACACIHHHIIVRASTWLLEETVPSGKAKVLIGMLDSGPLYRDLRICGYTASTRTQDWERIHWIEISFSNISDKYPEVVVRILDVSSMRSYISNHYIRARKLSFPCSISDSNSQFLLGLMTKWRKVRRRILYKVYHIIHVNYWYQINAY